MKIKSGEYVRTTTGEICKIEDILSPKEIKTHSSNIIDLIEVGDIVKVEQLDEIKEVIEDKFFDEYIFDHDVRAIIDDRSGSAYSEQLKHFKILKVVTHEQFQRMEYKVNNE